jgi:MFS superfamily sulfate permease-like transporter
MMIRDLVQLAPICITFVAGFFLSKSFLDLKVENIAWHAQDSFVIMENLSHQKADTVVGSILLFVAFIWQMINLTRPVLIGDFAGIPSISALVAIILTLLLSVLCYFASKCLGKSIYSKARAGIGGK